MALEQPSALQHEVLQLRKAVEELSLLNDLSRVISSTMLLDEVIKNIVSRAVKAVQGQQGMITLVDEESPNEMKTLVRTQNSVSSHPQFRLNQSILGWILTNKAPLIADDLSNDKRFAFVKTDGEFKSLVCVPLLVRNRIIGILAVFNKKNDGKFTEDDKRLLSIIGAQSGQVIENARLYEQEKNLISMREQLKLASQIQQELLPDKSPSIANYEIVGRSIPAQEVGGDYYDFVAVDEKRIAVCLGDVSGKGLPASLLMANVQATIRATTLATSSAKDCISRANKLLYDSTSDEKFVTFFYGILDSETHQFRFSNAGHDNPYFIRSNGECHRLQAGGVVLSILDFFPFEEEIITMERGDLIVMYSDGIPEAMNSNRELYGEERLTEVLLTQRSLPAVELIDKIMMAAKAHAGSYPQSDDMTIVVIKRTS